MKLVWNPMATLIGAKKNRYGNIPIERGTTILYVISFAELLVLITN